MYKRLQVDTESGLVVFRDANVAAPSENENDARGLLRSGERDGAWFFLDADDTVHYRIDLFVDEKPSGLPGHRFEHHGGTFLLRLPSGRLAVSGLERWATGRGGETVDIEAGAYALSVRGPGRFDGPAYAEEMRDVVGEREWRYRERVDRIGLVGCLSTVLAVALVALPVTRPLWFLPITVLAAGWIPFLVFQLLPRYRDIEQRIRSYERTLPHYAIQLRTTTAADDLVGGHLDVS